MALTDTLGYEVRPPNAVQRLNWKISSSRPGAWLFARTFHHVDKLLLRLTGGRLSLAGLLGGIPVITLVTTGARTGARREMPLLGVPADGDIAVIGTRFGQKHTPGWYFNLVARPEAEVVFRDRRAKVRAREATGEEWDVLWARGRQIYGGYEAYARRITGRDVHIMVLEEAG
jgi:deazaflavin-dependent oxidoreductase (nitroreductase family)